MEKKLTEVCLAFYNLRFLHLVDFNSIMEILLNELEFPIRVLLREMNEKEKQSVSEWNQGDKIVTIKKRFIILILKECIWVRKEEMENKIF